MIAVGNLVQHRTTGKRGVVVRDDFNLCEVPTEHPVVFEGTSGYQGTLEADLEDLGPENAVADMEKCGAGQGEQCCIFLTFGGAGWMCGRFGPLRTSIQMRAFAGTMNAKREPLAMFPECQIEHHPVDGQAADPVQ